MYCKKCDFTPSIILDDPPRCPKCHELLSGGTSFSSSSPSSFSSSPSMPSSSFSSSSTSSSIPEHFKDKPKIGDVPPKAEIKSEITFKKSPFEDGVKKELTEEEGKKLVKPRYEPPTSPIDENEEKTVGFGLGFGIFLLPPIFSWFTLRKGHTATSRIISFTYLGLVAVWIVIGASLMAGANSQPMAQSESPEAAMLSQVKPESAIQRYEIMKETGNMASICEHAGLVKAAYIQANDETNIEKWTQIEQSDCIGVVADK